MGWFPTLWARLIPPASERSRVKPLWPPSSSTSGFNIQFLKRGNWELIPRPLALKDMGFRGSNVGNSHIGYGWILFSILTMICRLDDEKQKKAYEQGSLCGFFGKRLPM